MRLLDVEEKERLVEEFRASLEHWKADDEGCSLSLTPTIRSHGAAVHFD